jgi:hypothetical protein
LKEFINKRNPSETGMGFVYGNHKTAIDLNILCKKFIQNTIMSNDVLKNTKTY